MNFVAFVGYFFFAIGCFEVKKRYLRGVVITDEVYTMTLKKFLNFFKSPYFHTGKVLLLCLFGATLTTLYPFHDLSLTDLYRLWAVWLLRLLMAAVCIDIVSLTWYWFHQLNYDTADNVCSISRHALYGGFLPIIFILSEISLVHSVDHLL